MNLLCMETCLGFYSVAVYSNGKLLSEQRSSNLNEQAEKLAESVKNCLSLAKLEFSDLEAIAITNGPGSFTGLRIGLSFAKGIKVAYPKLKIFSASTLELLAFSQVIKEGIVGINAGKNQHYMADFKDQALISDIYLVNNDEIRDGAILHSDFSIFNEALSGKNLGKLVNERLKNNLEINQALDPVYVREPDAIFNKSFSK
jgi:tRNA threonylcarbamoyladenosine biosynthesis protein TsaB